MSRSKDLEEKHQAEWEKNLYKNFSRDELDRIAAQDKEREEAQALIDKTVDKCVKAYPDLCSTPERNKEIQEAKKKREEERWREYHWMNGKRK